MGHEENPVAPTLVTTGTEDADLRLDRVEQFTRSGTIPTPVQTALDLRYRPSFFVPQAALQATSGTVTRADAGADTVAYGSLPDSVLTLLSGLVIIPSNWTNYAVDVIWFNPTAATGNVRWQYRRENIDTTAAFSPSITASTVLTAGAINTPKIDTVEATEAAPSSGYVAFAIGRDGADAGDTLAAACGLIGVIFKEA